MKITAVDIARVAASHYGVTTTDILSIMKVPTHPATLHDTFAAAAMQGLIAADTEGNISASDIAELAYAQADAMLEARGL